MAVVIKRATIEDKIRNNNETSINRNISPRIKIAGTTIRIRVAATIFNKMVAAINKIGRTIITIAVVVFKADGIKVRSSPFLRFNLYSVQDFHLV